MCRERIFEAELKPRKNTQIKRKEETNGYIKTKIKTKRINV